MIKFGKTSKNEECKYLFGILSECGLRQYDEAVHNFVIEPANPSPDREAVTVPYWKKWRN